MRLSKRPRGVFLLTILFLVILILMFVGAALSLAPGGMARGRQSAESLAADRATQAGLEYARARLNTDPTWTAKNASTFTQGGLTVTEGQGQVIGWIQDGNNYSRFRIRFNYQDGSASADPASDGLDDPAQPWKDFTLVSSNNLPWTFDRPIPYADTPSGGVAANNPRQRLMLPARNALLSVEGSCGSPTFTDGVPVDFSGRVSTHTAEVVLKLSGLSQPVADAAVMTAGDLSVDLGSGQGQVLLDATQTQATRTRSRGSLTVTGGATTNLTSVNGELRAVKGADEKPDVHASLPDKGVLLKLEDPNNGFYSIPWNQVKTPTDPIHLAGGVYALAPGPSLNYYNMSYLDYTSAYQAGTLSAGTPVSMTDGMSLKENTGTGPKYTLQISRDIQIDASSVTSEFALVPAGGVADSRVYYATRIANQYTTGIDTRAASAENESEGNSRGGPPGVPVVPIPVLAPVINPIIGALGPKGGQPVAILNGGDGQPVAGSSDNAQQADTAKAVSPALGPADIQLKLVSGTTSTTVIKAPGDITIGAQFQGLGASLISEGGIKLLGLSTDIQAATSATDGLDLYAKGDITIDAFQLDATGGKFRNLSLKGVIYSWGKINVLLGNSALDSGWGKFSLDGAMVAYGGDPAGKPGSTAPSSINLKAQSIDLKFDPSYLINLTQQFPKPLQFQTMAYHLK